MAQDTDCFKKRLRLSAVGDRFSPNHVTEVLGITPTKSFEVGDEINPRKKASKPIWSITVVPDCNNEEELLWKLMKIIESGKEGFITLRQEGIRFMLSFAVIEKGYMPGFQLSESALRTISEFGFFLDVDIYVNAERQ